MRLPRLISNWLVGRRETVNLWVDDERPAPKGWYWAISAEEAIDILVNYQVVDCSFDHDLGEGFSGGALVSWLSWQLRANGLNFWPKNKPTVHSMNPVGRRNILATIENDGPYNEEEE